MSPREMSKHNVSLPSNANVIQFSFVDILLLVLKLLTTKTSSGSLLVIVDMVGGESGHKTSAFGVGVSIN